MIINLTILECKSQQLQEELKNAGNNKSNHIGM